MVYEHGKVSGEDILCPLKLFPSEENKIQRNAMNGWDEKSGPDKSPLRILYKVSWSSSLPVPTAFRFFARLFL